MGEVIVVAQSSLVIHAALWLSTSHASSSPPWRLYATSCGSMPATTPVVAAGRHDVGDLHGAAHGGAGVHAHVPAERNGHCGAPGSRR